MGLDNLDTSLTWPDFGASTSADPKPPQKGDKGFLRSGLSAIARRLSYQPPHTKSAKQLKLPQNINSVQ